MIMKEQNFSPQPTSWQAWMIAIRPHTLPAAAAPVIVAWSITYQQGGFSLPPALAALVCALLLQITSNLVNDVMDFKKGADRSGRQGFQRVTQDGLLSPRQVWTGIALVIFLAVAAGSYLVWLRGIWALLIGGLAIVFAVAYTAGPFSLAYHGLGDLFVMVFFGFAGLCGTVYAILGWVPAISWLFAFNMGALITAILVVNNVRDVESDRAAGRKNIPVVYGLETAYWEFRTLVGLPYITLIPAAILTGQPLLLLPWLTLPLALHLAADLARNKGTELNPVLGQTAQLALYYGLLLAVAISLS
jgi:1,4-dihydroxy-2-naphthoate octaprenyltransferase